MNIFNYLKYLALAAAIVVILAVQYFIGPKDPAEAQMIDDVIERVIQEESGVDLSSLVSAVASPVPAASTTAIPTTNAL